MEFFEEYEYCFAPESLDFFTVQNTNENAPQWAGAIHFQHSDVSWYSTTTKCLNCECQCVGMTPEEYQDGCGGTCSYKKSQYVGVSMGPVVEQETKCINGLECPFKVQWKSKLQVVTYNLGRQGLLVLYCIRYS